MNFIKFNINLKMLLKLKLNKTNKRKILNNLTNQYDI